MKEYQADVLTAVPRQLTQSFWEHAVLPLLHITYLSWLFLPLIWRNSDPRFLSANGQVLAIKLPAKEICQTFEAIKAEIVDDMAFCRHLKKKGKKILFVDGYFLAHCRMYENFMEIWNGFSKNIYPGIGYSPILLMFILFLYLGVYIAPLFSIYGFCLILSIRILLAIRFKHHFLSVLLHPISIILFCALSLNSFFWAIGRKVSWKGRHYG